MRPHAASEACRGTARHHIYQHYLADRWAGAWPGGQPKAYYVALVVLYMLQLWSMTDGGLDGPWPGCGWDGEGPWPGAEPFALEWWGVQRDLWREIDEIQARTVALRDGESLRVEAWAPELPSRNPRMNPDTSAMALSLALTYGSAAERYSRRRGPPQRVPILGAFYFQHSGRRNAP